MVFIQQQQRGQKGCSWKNGTAVTCQSSIIIGTCTKFPMGFVGILLLILVAGCHVWEGQRYVIGVLCPFPCSSQQDAGVPPPIENITVHVVLRDEALSIAVVSRSFANKSVVDDNTTIDHQQSLSASSSTTRGGASMIYNATMDDSTLSNDNERASATAPSLGLYPYVPHAPDPYDDVPDTVKMFWKPDCGGKCRREFCLATTHHFQ